MTNAEFMSKLDAIEKHYHQEIAEVDRFADWEKWEAITRQAIADAESVARPYHGEIIDFPIGDMSEMNEEAKRAIRNRLVRIRENLEGVDDDELS